MSIKELAPNYFTRKKAILGSLGKGRMILNVGCGDGDYDGALKKRFSGVFGVDVNQADLSIARQRNKGRGFFYVLASAEALPFRKGVFDEAVCADVLEHLDSDKKALKEVNRVLKRKARLLLNVPNSGFPFSYDPVNFVLNRFFGKRLPIGLWGFGHKRLYSKKSIEKVLSDAGFSVESKQCLLHLFSGIFENYYLVNLLQPLTKTSRSNRPARKSKKPLLSGTAPAAFAGVRDWVIEADNAIFRDSEDCLQFFVEAKKK